MAHALSLVALASFLLVVAAAASSSWEPCDSSSNYQVKIKNVEVRPDPVISGEEATFIVPATASERIDSGKLIISVLFFGITVHREVDDLCQKTACPIEAGDFTLESSQILPSFTPSGKYKIKLEVASGARKLACARVSFDIAKDVSSSGQ